MLWFDESVAQSIGLKYLLIGITISIKCILENLKREKLKECEGKEVY